MREKKFKKGVKGAKEQMGLAAFMPSSKIQSYPPQALDNDLERLVKEEMVSQFYAGCMEEEAWRGLMRVFLFLSPHSASQTEKKTTEDLKVNYVALVCACSDAERPLVAGKMGDTNGHLCIGPGNKLCFLLPAASGTQVSFGFLGSWGNRRLDTALTDDYMFVCGGFFFFMTASAGSHGIVEYPQSCGAPIRGSVLVVAAHGQGIVFALSSECVASPHPRSSQIRRLQWIFSTALALLPVSAWLWQRPKSWPCWWMVGAGHGVRWKDRDVETTFFQHFIPPGYREPQAESTVVACWPEIVCHRPSSSISSSWLLR